ncbi:L-rhamnose/proton symporter RhaT [Neolewinella sp.]|uniref:L-rhamnose/proton symporter RhaT n=1 Tax=Neolewinella sp. TaxID=2993543 RepID=UPI003B52590D
MGALFGLVFHAIGGFAAGSFYLPVRKVEGWAWEASWFVLGLTAWLLVPIVVALLTTQTPLAVLAAATPTTLFYAFLFGLLWGIGGLTFGLSMRYLGISLGMAVALGFSAAFGTLVPPIYAGTFGELLLTGGGRQTLLGIGICLAGIGLCGYAGMLKEREQDQATKQAAVAEFDLGRGLTVAVVSGLLSACFAFALAAGEPLGELAEAAGTRPLFRNNVALVVILLGGLLTNLAYCGYLFLRRGTQSDLTAPDTPNLRNGAWSALGGATWYFQFFFYGMGVVYLGERYDFASWTLHMAFIILFSTLWGLYLREWRGSSRRVIGFLVAGLVTLVGSTVVIGLA